MKRVVSFLLVLALLLGLTACGEKAPTWQEQYDLGVRYLSEGNYEEAILAFTAAIEIDPKRAEAYIGRGEAYQLNGDLQNALLDFETAFELSPDEPDLLERLIELYEKLAIRQQEQGDEQAAKDTLNQGVQNTGSEKLSELLDAMTSGGDTPTTLPDDGIARTVIEVRDAAHLLELVNFDNLPNLSNTELRLHDGVYDLGNNTLFLNGVENLSIVGTGKTEIVVQSGDELIIYIDGSSNVQICGLTMGHSVDVYSGCTEGVICNYGTDVKIYNCDIYGCGVVGIHSSGEGLEVVNTIIRDCSLAGATFWGGSANFSGCTFSGNSYKDKSQVISANGGAKVTLTDCKFIDNPAAEKMVVSEATEWAPASTVNETGTVESGNGWQ